MSDLEKKDLHSDDDEEEDDDYCPNKNENNQQSNSSASESDDEEVTNELVEEKKQDDLNIKPYDQSKTDDLWKNFTSKPSVTESPKPQTTDSKETTKVFDYAGEKVTVPVVAPTLKRPAPAGAASVLDRLGIGKKPKLSTLEKSRLDWSAHKQAESLTDDLDLHRRGKESYVEKKAFLQRTEVREHDHYLNHIKKK